MIKSYFKNLKLQSQLMIVSLSTIIISFLLILLILPNILTPFYENNIYQMLEQPLKFINSEKNINNGEIAYVIFTNNNAYYSNNIYDLLKTNDVSKIVENLKTTYGKFKVNGRTFYFNTENENNTTTIALTNDSYVKTQQKSLNSILIPIMSFSILMTILILNSYSNHLMKKIAIINKKVKNIDNDKYMNNEKFYMNDELNSLLNSIENTRVSLQEKEKQKSSMFQNISHELKTPITVISSHIEAANDKVITKSQALKVIKDETDNLNKKVSLIMKLNKLSYLENNVSYKEIDITPIVNTSISKFKIVKGDINFNLIIKNKVTFVGNEENWETIINNILENYIRFAKEEIRITIDENKIEFYNDGEHIKENRLEDIFEPYKVDSKGKHGLGLAIVKQMLNLSGYGIKAKNLESGVLFEIFKK